MKNAALPLTGLLLFAAGCTRMKVSTEVVRPFDFSGVSTYRWVAGPEPDPQPSDTQLYERIRDALGLALQHAGFRAVTADADLQAVCFIRLREQTEYTTPAGDGQRDFSGGLTFRRDGQGWSYAEREPDINLYTVEIGTLFLLLYDAGTEDLVWRGSLQTRIDRSRPPEEQMERIRQAAEKLVRRIPSAAR